MTPEHARPFLLQMAGISGSGKSTLARRVAANTGAVVIDMDVLKSTALDAGAEWEFAGKLAYRTSWSLAESLLEQRLSVILDSPCRFEQILTETEAIARRQDVAYGFVECNLPDTEELGRRLRKRPRLRSQMVDVGVSSADAPSDRTAAALARADGPGVFQTRYPAVPWLQVDTRHGPDHCLALALAYLDDRRRSLTLCE